MLTLLVLSYGLYLSTKGTILVSHFIIWLLMSNSFVIVTNNQEHLSCAAKSEQRIRRIPCDGCHQFHIHWVGRRNLPIKKGFSDLIRARTGAAREKSQPSLQSTLIDGRWCIKRETHELFLISTWRNSAKFRLSTNFGHFCSTTNRLDLSCILCYLKGQKVDYLYYLSKGHIWPPQGSGLALFI